MSWFQSTPPRRRRRKTAVRIRPSRIVSIHAPAKEATSTSLGDGDCGGVSIHAPAKEATNSLRAFVSELSGFNPRPREGGDLDNLKTELSSTAFQSTPPRRRRQVAELRDMASLLFQSTPPRRRRLSNRRAA